MSQVTLHFHHCLIGETFNGSSNPPTRLVPGGGGLAWDVPVVGISGGGQLISTILVEAIP